MENKEHLVDFVFTFYSYITLLQCFMHWHIQWIITKLLTQSKSRDSMLHVQYISMQDNNNEENMGLYPKLPYL